MKTVKNTVPDLGGEGHWLRAGITGKGCGLLGECSAIRIILALQECVLAERGRVNHSPPWFRKAEILDRAATHVEKRWFRETRLALFQNAFCKRELRGNPLKFRRALKRIKQTQKSVCSSIPFIFPILKSQRNTKFREFSRKCDSVRFIGFGRSPDY